MKLVLISDTYGGHQKLGRLRGDVLIHCGDMEHLFRQSKTALSNIDAWFGLHDLKHVFCIGGNHDLALEQAVQRTNKPFQNATLLHDSAVVLNGVKFYGAPWVPQLHLHAFFAGDRALIKAWSAIPSDVDVLLTHTPPLGILDRSSRGKSLGCPHLLKRLQHLTPKLHCFCHVHASAGLRQIGQTTYANATSVNSALEIANRPLEIEL